MSIDAKLLCKGINERNDDAKAKGIDDHDKDEYPKIFLVLHKVVYIRVKKKGFGKNPETFFVVFII